MSGRSRPVVAAPDTGAVEAANLLAIADAIQGGHDGIYGEIGPAFFIFLFFVFSFFLLGISWYSCLGQF